MLLPVADLDINGSRHSEEQIVGVLKEVQVPLPVAEVCIAGSMYLLEVVLLVAIGTCRKLSAGHKRALRLVQIGPND